MCSKFMLLRDMKTKANKQKNKYKILNQFDEYAFSILFNKSY